MYNWDFQLINPTELVPYQSPYQSLYQSPHANSNKKKGENLLDINFLALESRVKIDSRLM